MDAHRGTSSGTPLVLLHGLTGSWPIWRPILPALEAAHRVFAPTLPGHHGAKRLGANLRAAVPTLADALEAQLDGEGISKAHLVGNSLGGWLALELARRGRALSVVALSPAGAWQTASDVRRVVGLIGRTTWLLTQLAGIAKQIARHPTGRRLLLRQIMEHGERVPQDEVVALFDAAIGCSALGEILDSVRQAPSFPRGTSPLDHPVRIAWSEFDRTIPFENYGRPMVAAVPGCELVHLRGVGHVPMYDDPDLVVRTILEVTRAVDGKPASPSRVP